MPSATYVMIKNAILNKQQVFAIYDGYRRELCPHAIGHKGGIEQALFYQFGGETSKGRVTTDTKNNWKCMTISKLSNVTVYDGEWHTFENHSRPSTCTDIIDVEVEF